MTKPDISIEEQGVRDVETDVRILREMDQRAEQRLHGKDCNVLVTDDVDPQSRINTALSLISCFGGTDGAHHKQWVLDQIVRALAPDYATWVREHRDGDDGPETYDWDEGVAP